MPKTHPPMKLSHEEDVFLRHWMFDEVHYQDRQGPAKQLQIEHGASPADVAILIAAAIPDTLDQEAAGLGPPPAEAAQWPWSDDGFRSRLMEARTILGERKTGYCQ